MNTELGYKKVTFNLGNNVSNLLYKPYVITNVGVTKQGFQIYHGSDLSIDKEVNKTAVDKAMKILSGVSSATGAALSLLNSKFISGFIPNGVLSNGASFLGALNTATSVGGVALRAGNNLKNMNLSKMNISNAAQKLNTAFGAIGGAVTKIGGLLGYNFNPQSFSSLPSSLDGRPSDGWIISNNTPVYIYLKDNKILFASSGGDTDKMPSDFSQLLYTPNNTIYYYPIELASSTTYETDINNYINTFYELAYRNKYNPYPIASTSSIDQNSDSTSYDGNAHDIYVKIQRIGDTTKGSEYLIKGSVTSLGDSSSGHWSERKYLGRPLAAQRFTGYSRGVSFELKLFAENHRHLDRIIELLNMLHSLHMPTSIKSNIGLGSPFFRFSLGDMFNTNNIYKLDTLDVKVPDSAMWDVLKDRQYPLVYEVHMSLGLVFDFDYTTNVKFMDTYKKLAPLTYDYISETQDKTDNSESQNDNSDIDVINQKAQDSEDAQSYLPSKMR
jgi:hypothetical protein